MLETVLSHIDGQRDLVIELQRGMTAIPALGPENEGNGEIDKAAYLSRWLAENNITDVTELRAPDSRVECGYRPTLVARIPGKSDRTLWVIGHTDVVPPGDLSLWETNPYEMVVDGDFIQGRGVEDNQQAIVSGLLTAKAFIDNNITPEFSLGLIFVADEETGSHYGLEYILKEYPDFFKKDDLILVPDMGNDDGTMVEVAEKSIFWQKATVLGKQCHASRPSLGVNSLVAASAFVLKVNRLHDEFPASNEIFEPPMSTFTPTRKDANVPNVNTVPGSDVVYIDCRVMPDYDLDDIRKAFRTIADEVETEYGVKIKLEEAQAEQAAPPTPADAEIVQRLIPAIREVYGNEAKPMGVGGGTVAAHLRRLGYEVVVWGRLVHNAHEPNEKSRISYNIGDAKVIARVAMGCK